MKIEGIKGVAGNATKAWSWSYSKLKNFAACPKKHYEIDLCGNWKETQDDDPNSPLNWGNRLHKAFADALKGTAALPAEMKVYQPWIDRVLKGPGQLLVEQKYAINRNFEKTGYYANDVWVRMIGDAVRIHQDIGLVLDWKTGKIVEDSVQLMLMAQALFSYYPDLKYVRSEFVWLKEDCTTPELFTRKEVGEQWVDLIQRVNELEQAAINLNYPPKPGGLCMSYCPVKSCPYWKKGSR